jgi:hypothetical protein
MTVESQVVFWRDIPAQVRAREGSNRASRPLAQRFQVAIDEAAMRAGATGAQDYLDDWHTTEWQSHDGELQAVLDSVVFSLETIYGPGLLRSLIAGGGRRQMDSDPTAEENLG